MTKIDNRVNTYIKVLQYFQKYPFEEEYCGLSKREALILVQTFLENVNPATPVNLLTNADLLVKKQQPFTKLLSNYDSQVNTALQLLTPLLNIDEATPEKPMAPSIPQNIRQIVATFENEVQQSQGTLQDNMRRSYRRNRWEDEDIVETHTYQDKNGKEKTTKSYDSNQEMVERELLRVRNEALMQQRASARQADILKNKTLIAEQIALSVSQGQSNPDLEKIISDTLDFPLEEEKKYWDTLGVDLNQPSTQADLSEKFPEARAIKIKEVYKQKIAADTRLAGQTDAINQAIDAVAADNLLEYSYLKHFENFANQGDFEARRMGIGKLLFGKLMAEAEHACQDLTGIDAAKRDDLKTKAVLETYYSIYGEGISFVENPSFNPNALLLETLRKKFRRAVKTEELNKISTSPIFNVTAEAQELIALDTQKAILTKQSTDNIHTLPIPGLLFLDSMSTAEILADNTVFETLKTRSVDEVFQNVKTRYLEQAGLPQLEEQFKLEKDPLVAAQIKQQIDYYKGLDPTQVFFNSFFIESIGGEGKISPEEIAIIKRYLATYQQFIKKPVIGQLLHISASMRSMKKQVGIPFFRNIIGDIPFVYLAGYGKAFLSVAIGDPSMIPYAFGYFAKQYATGAIGLKIKGRVADIFGRRLNGWVADAFSKIVKRKTAKGLANFLTGFIVFREHGMVIIPILNPWHAVQAVAKKSFKKLVQTMVNQTVKWVARLAGREAAVALAATLVGSAIPVIGTVLGIIFTAGDIIWNFLIPGWLKKALAIAAAGLIWLLINLWGLVWSVLTYLLGPLGAAGFLIGIFFPILGPLTPLIFGGFGTLVGIGGWLWFGWHTAPGWIMGLAPGWGGIFGAIGKGLSGLWHALTAAPAVSAASATGGYIAIGTVAGAGVGSYLAITFLTTAMWTPVTPQGVPGGAVATSFTVEKSVSPTDTTYCPDFTSKKNCSNAVTLSSNNTGFEYTIRIVAAPGKTVSNIQIKDKITILAQGPCGTNLEDDCPKGTVVKKYEITPNTNATDLSKITLTNPGTPAIDIKYPVPPLLLQEEKFRNSAVMNLVEVTANGEKATNGVVFTIGHPPLSSCPIPYGQISCGSLGGKDASGKEWTCQHGSDTYWSNKTICEYAIPYLTGTMGNSVSYSNATVCKTKTPNREDYGFAADVVPGIDDTVLFPSIYGENLTWTKVNPGSADSNHGGAWGWGGFYEAKGSNYSYRIYVTHLRKDDLNTTGGASGTKLGTICRHSRNECDMWIIVKGVKTDNAHVHIEIQQIDNVSGTKTTLRPEFLCLY